MRLKPRAEDENGDVPITPLIDCVFLLIIFFLVTSMFKRFEMLIPIELPDTTASLSERVRNETLALGISATGVVEQAESFAREGDREVIYSPIGDFAAFLQNLGDPELPLEFSVEAETPTQKVVDVLDIAQLQGFDDVSVKIKPVR